MRLNSLSWTPDRVHQMSGRVHIDHMDTDADTYAKARTACGRVPPAGEITGFWPFDVNHHHPAKQCKSCLRAGW